MIYRPIRFTPDNVQAILAGRKTHTRRRIDIQPHYGLGYMMGHEQKYAIQCGPDYPDGLADQRKCPYGAPGDGLWVREPWACNISYDSYKPSEVLSHHIGAIWYKAGGGHTFENGELGRLRSSTFMPRWASRISLQIESVGVQQLQSISEEDCVAEGVIKLPATGRYVLVRGGQYFGQAWNSAREAYRSLWESINGPDSWAANPWVWIVAFKRIEEAADGPVR